LIERFIPGRPDKEIEMAEEDKCAVCYTCQSNIAPNITAEQIKDAQAKGDIPKEWFVGNCSACFSCQRCISAQEQNCAVCYECQSHYGG